MREIEVKVLNIDRKAIEKKLCAMGAKKVFSGEVHALFFDERKTLRSRRQTLRLRLMGNESYLTFKGFIPGTRTKVRDEHEVKVADFQKTRKILEGLGYSVWLEMKKHRTSYTLGKVHVEFDKYHDHFSFVPEFLEIEGPTEREIFRMVRTLGFDKKDCKPWTILDVVKHNYPRKQNTYEKTR